MYCYNCGQEVDELDTHCFYCGTELRKGVFEEKPIKKDEPKENKIFYFLAGLFSFFMPFVGIILAIIFYREQPKAAKAAIIGAIIALVFTAMIIIINIIASIFITSSF